mmetsp:Transcript_35759/g.93523  ORF Transcript_35759/g.93523 Transcript_35759/m.93523 type:complete len:498 (+) Transcript_35759:144-1637(+)
MAPSNIRVRPRSIGLALAAGAVVFLLVRSPYRSTQHDAASVSQRQLSAERPGDAELISRWASRLSRAIDPRVAAEDPAYDELARWMLRSGAEFSAVSGHSRRFAAGGRGLFATEAIKSGSVILRIPAECWFSHRQVLRASAVSHVILDDAVVKKLVKEDQSWAVIIGLLYERTNEFSPWLPYMRFMRRQESTVWWSDAELSETQSPHVIASTHAIQHDIKEVYDRLFPYLVDTYPTMFDAELHDFPAFTWATLTMWGRAFNVVGYNSTADTEYGLVPIADLLNHEGGKPSTWSMEYHDTERPSDPSMFVMEANRDYTADQELTISYGDRRSSFNFFVYSGFTPRGQTYGDFIAVQVTGFDGSVQDTWGCIGVDGRPQATWVKQLQTANPALSSRGFFETFLHAAEKHIAGWPTDVNADAKQMAALSTYGSLWAALNYRIRYKSIYTKLRDNLKAALAGADLSLPQYTSKVDKNNECYRHRRGWSNYDYAMDHMHMHF